MTRIYQHWTGNLTAREAPVHTETNAIDEWFPSLPPEGATLSATDIFEAPTQVFHGVQHVKLHVGPVQVTIGEDLLFQGTVEYYEAPS